MSYISTGGPGYLDSGIPQAVSPGDFLGFCLETLLGMPGTSGYSIVEKLCHSNAAQGTYGELWYAGPKELVRFTNAEKLIVRSTSASDAVGSSGAHVVRIYGLDNAFRPFSEDVTLSGVTPVTTSGSYLRVNGARIISGLHPSGAVGFISGIGQLTPSHQFSLSSMSDMHNIATQSQFTVPSGYNAYLIEAAFSSVGLAAGKTVLIGAEKKTNPSGVWLNMGHWEIDDNHHPIFIRNNIPNLIEEMADFRLYFTTTDTSISLVGHYTLLMVHRGVAINQTQRFA